MYFLEKQYTTYHLHDTQNLGGGDDMEEESLLG
jgi:hypothetical protein